MEKKTLYALYLISPIFKDDRVPCLNNG